MSVEILLAAWLWAADEAVDANAAGPSMLATLAPFFILLPAFYLLIVVPENRKRKKQQEELGRVKKGDEVLMNSGIIGVVANVKDDRVTLKVDESRGVTIEFAKSSISQILKSKGGDADAAS